MVYGRSYARTSWIILKSLDNVAINITSVTASRELEIDLEEEDFTDLFENEKHPHVNGEMIDFLEQQNKEEDVYHEPRHFIIKKMQQLFACIEKCFSKFEDMDTNLQPFSKMMVYCLEAVAPYNIILAEKKKTVQGSLNRF